jgi:chemotaxis protein MotA
MAANPVKARSERAKLDLATCGGLVLALGGILGGLVLEGGNIRDVSQVTAAMIVFGGTLGAVMVTTPVPVLLGAVGKFGQVFTRRDKNPAATIEEIIRFATKARRSGIVSLETDLPAVSDPFLQKALGLAIDGMELKELRKMMELEIGLEEQRSEEHARVYEAAGGYAPTIGIIGAVLGLIQVMKNLENIEEVGRGIAVAFVATVYGVGSANIFFLPSGNKLKARAREQALLRELTLEGVAAIVEGLNPKLIRMKLEAYVKSGDDRKSSAAGGRSAAAASAAFGTER